MFSYFTHLFSHGGAIFGEAGLRFCIGRVLATQGWYFVGPTRRARRSCGNFIVSDSWKHMVSLFEISK